MKNIFKFLLLTMVVMFGLQSCDDDSNIVGGGIDPEPELTGCEATTFYDWNDFEFSTSLDAGATTWLGFDLDETTLFSINLNQAGFHCAIFEGCDGELGLPPPLYSFMSNGNGQEVGIVTEGMYFLEITNTRPGRLDFDFSISLSDIVYGCMNDDAQNYNADANVDDGSCLLQDCTIDYYVEEYDVMASETEWWPLVLDCNGNCGPANWNGDGWCDDGAWAIYDENGEIVPIDFYCAELGWDNGDCEAIDEGCTEGLIEDCNGICAPEGWLGDGFCDDGSYEYNGNQIFFNCEEFNNDEGDCDAMGRTTETRPYPNGRIKVQ
tara:strand:- start:1238 stop:2203 length:966 start_codon:yes stop_codon:yes gene_type:complete